MFSTVNRTADRSAPWRRASLAMLAAGLLAPSLVARGLTPDRRGFGTHEQLGLAPCGFLTWTRRRCPTCGMTTSFSHAARFDWSRALAANPAGTLLAVASWIAAAWAAGSAARGRPIVPLDPLLTALASAAAIALLALVVWIGRLVND